MGRRWFTNPYVIVITLTSLVAVGMAGLSLLLLPQPSEIVMVMQRRMAKLHAFTMTADVQWRGELRERDVSGELRTRDERVSFSTTAVIDRSDAKTSKFQQSFDLRVGTTDPRTFAGEQLHFGSRDLFRFSILPSVLGNLRFDAYRDRWLAVDFRELATPLAIPLVGSGRVLSADDVVKLAEQFGHTPFFQVQEKSKSEPVDGVPVNHYKVRVEPLYLKDFFRQHEELRLGRDLSAKERLAADTFFANLSSDDGELWIGTRDGLLHRMRLRFRYDDSKRTGTLDIAADFSRFNEPVLVTPPTEEVQDVTGILASLLAGIAGHLPMAEVGGAQVVGSGDGGGLPVQSGETKDDTDKDGLPDAVEAFYGSDQRNPDSDGDGISDGDEVARGNSPTGPGKLFDFTGGQFD